MVKFPHLLIAASVLVLVAGCSSAPAESPSDKASASATEGSAVPDMASTVAVAAEQPAIVPSSFRATGTEPFWSARVDGKTLTWSTPELPEGVAVPVIRKDEGGTAVLAATVADQPLELKVTQGPCSDGMSDTVYPLTVTRRLGGDTQRGCAR